MAARGRTEGEGSRSADATRADTFARRSIAATGCWPAYNADTGNKPAPLCVPGYCRSSIR